MSLEQNYPLESEAQRIGQRAQKCFSTNRPDSWRERPLDGTDDAGFDYQIQIVDSARYIGIFRMQLKGSESPEINATGEFFSISLSRRTLNYYARVTEPILLVFADLSVDLTVTKNCPCFYVWIHDELKRHRESGKDGSDSNTLVVRVPLANRLTEETDLLPTLETNLRLFKAAASLDAMLAEKLPSSDPDGRSQLLENMATGLSGYGSTLLNVVATPATSPWPEAPSDSFAGRLGQVDRHLRIGATEKAGALLDLLALELESATDLEKAEYWYCRGRICSWKGDTAGAANEYARACELSQDQPRYVVAWGEMQLTLHFGPETDGDLGDVKARLVSTDVEVRTLLARVMAAEGDFDGATQVLAKLDRREALPTLGIVASMQGRQGDVVAFCDEGLAQPAVISRHQQLFLILRARAKFTLAMPEDARGAGDYVIASWSGPSVIDTSLLRDSWDDIVQSVASLRESGWPNNLEFVADIWGATALMLGRAGDTIHSAREAAAARPHIEVMQRTLELMAVNVDDYDAALAANARQLRSAEQAFRRIGILHQARAHPQCLAAVEEGLDNLPQDHELYAVSVALGVLSADRLYQTDRADVLVARLKARPEWEGHFAILKYFRATASDVLRRDAALAELIADYTRLGRPKAVALQLFHVLDASDAEQAKLCVEVAEHIREFQQLPIDGEFQLAQAHVTLTDWSALLSVANRAIAKFDHVGRFFAIRALALDKLGLSPDALTELRRLLDAGVSDQLATDTYVNIVTRSGFTDEALQLAERLLGQETNKARRLDCLQLLFNLLQAKEPGSKRSIDVAWAVDQSDELAEGQFLATFLAATARLDKRGDDARAEEFWKRVERFVTRWPESRILRRGSIPENATPAEMMKLFRQVLGDTQQTTPERLKLSRQLSRGEVPVPYSWRPRMVLPNILDVGQLWDIGKRSNRDAHQYHLAMVVGAWVERPFSDRPVGLPLLDITALFVIQDLGLFDTLFAVFPTIAVSQALLLDIRERASPLVGSWAQPQYASLVEELRNRFEYIQQPVSNLPATEAGPKSHLLSDDMRLLVDNERYFAYSDDAALRMYVSNSDDPACGMCTLDLLRFADDLGLLSAQEVGEKIGLLCTWNVGLAVTQRYLLASLPSEIGTAQDTARAVDIIRSSPTCSAIFEGIWSVRKPFAEMVRHVSSMMASLVSDERNELRTVAAIFGVWHLKAKLRTDIGESKPIERTALVVSLASMQVSVQSKVILKRLWDVFRYIVELEYGDRMDEAKERDAIATMAEYCAQLDSAAWNATVTKRYGDAMRKGLEEGTADFDRFGSAYEKVETFGKQQQVAESIRRLNMS